MTVCILVVSGPSGGLGFKESSTKRFINKLRPVLWRRSRPEPKFFARAGLKSSGSGLLLRDLRFCGDKIATILIILVKF